MPYSYRDSYRASREEHDWLRYAKMNKTCNLDNLSEEQDTFSTAVLECDLDLSAEVMYKAYDKHWEIEVAIWFYKLTCKSDEVRIREDYFVIRKRILRFPVNSVYVSPDQDVCMYKFARRPHMQENEFSAVPAEMVRIPGED